MGVLSACLQCVKKSKIFTALKETPCVSTLRHAMPAADEILKEIFSEQECYENYQHWYLSSKEKETPKPKEEGGLGLGLTYKGDIVFVVVAVLICLIVIAIVIGCLYNMQANGRFKVLRGALQATNAFDELASVPLIRGCLNSCCIGRTLIDICSFLQSFFRCCARVARSERVPTESELNERARLERARARRERAHRQGQGPANANNALAIMV